MDKETRLLAEAAGLTFAAFVIGAIVWSISVPNAIAMAVMAVLAFGLYTVIGVAVMAIGYMSIYLFVAKLIPYIKTSGDAFFIAREKKKRDN